MDKAREEQNQEDQQQQSPTDSAKDAAKKTYKAASDLRRASNNPLVRKGAKYAGNLTKRAASQLGKRAAVFLAESSEIWVPIFLILVVIILIAVLLIIILGGSNSSSTSSSVGGCNQISESSLTATPANPTILTASNCENIPSPLVYKWTTSDPGGVLSNPSGASTNYTPSSASITDVVITLVICNFDDPKNCSSPETTVINSTSAAAKNVKFYCQYASAWQTQSCRIANYGCTQTSVAMAMSSYRTDTLYNPLRVALDNGAVDGCSQGTSVNHFNGNMVNYMNSRGYTVAPNIANGNSFNIGQAKTYIDQGFVIVAGGPVWFNSNSQTAPGGHAFLIVGADPSTNTISVYDPTYCPWLGGDTLSKGVRTMVPQTISCSYTAFDTNGNATASNCLGKNSGGSRYVFNISNGGKGWYWARPVKY